MLTIDASKLVKIVEDALNALLVTIPSKFIDATLGSGLLYDIWIKLFGNPDFITLFFILGLMGGTILILQRNYGVQMRGGIDL